MDKKRDDKVLIRFNLDLNNLLNEEFDSFVDFAKYLKKVQDMNGVSYKVKCSKVGNHFKLVISVSEYIINYYFNEVLKNE